jgi:hypothetical protein
MWSQQQPRLGGHLSSGSGGPASISISRSLSGGGGIGGTVNTSKAINEEDAPVPQYTRHPRPRTKRPMRVQVVMEGQLNNIIYAPILTHCVQAGLRKRPAAACPE